MGPPPPLVTVCIPCFNHAEFLGGAIESALRQRGVDVEVLVFDDGSTDESRDVAGRYAADDGRVRLLQHEGGVNRGIVATLNAAHAAATGTYLVDLAADDLLFEDSLRRRIAAFRAEDETALVYGHVEALAADGTRTGTIGGMGLDAICAADKTDDPLRALLLHNFVPGPGALFRRDVLDAVGPYDGEIYYTDWDLWVRILARRPFAFVGGAPVAGIRIHGRQLTDEDAALDGPRRLDFYRRLDRKQQLIGGRFEDPRLQALVSLQLAQQAALLGRLDEAAEAVDSAFAGDGSLRDDADFLFWWLALCQRRRVGEATGEPGAVRLGDWMLDAMRDAQLEARTARRLALALLADGVEAAGRARFDLLPAIARWVVRDPRLAGDRHLQKLALAAVGLWSLALRLRAVLSGRDGRP